VITPTTA